MQTNSSPFERAGWSCRRRTRPRHCGKRTSNAEEHMQTRVQQIALGMALILAAGCAGQQVSTDYSPATGFSQFRTFALVMPPDTAAQQLLDQRVRNAVQTQLGAKGLTATDRENADLYVG